jgi:hypothetical protein
MGMVKQGVMEAEQKAYEIEELRKAKHGEICARCGEPCEEPGDDLCGYCQHVVDAEDR